MLINSIVNVFRLLIIKGRISTVTMKTVSSFGTNVNVCSDIDVAAWKIDITKPTIKDASRSGPLTIST
ncbi:MAG: hypothetical protein A2X61_12745 [Ignavibacteria bacterium GWB2_35_12]|nr:MAG: hypothetical protein A2X63_02595 [Ignavibacteria bacterium GWA2_35_8]OGU41493.1 MAG: hypothetical protein A2X61_12745 [Ignavibacteria bacterium GWB2_35_12]OGV22967.1 MAG: hypothetical protein A2475_10215 [Ignavibacteria bacterium RIFOXYC2_FULL_35_21]